jgi:hypothetical protein
MTVHVGELTSEVQVQGGQAGGSGGGDGPGASEQPMWEERSRMARVADELGRQRERTAGERFDG